MIELLKSPQATQRGEWESDVVRAIATLGKSFEDLDAKVQAKFKGQLADIAKLSDQVADQRHGAAERFRALAGEYQRGTLFQSGAARERAAAAGKMIVGAVQNDAEAKQTLTASIGPGSDPGGGYLLVEQYANDLMRDVEVAGAFMRNCPPIPVTELAGGSNKATAGVTVYYPAYGVAATASTPAFGRSAYALKRHVAATHIDNWMLAGALNAVLGEFIRRELAYGIDLATDNNWWIGDGTAAYNGYTGLFKLAQAAAQIVEGDAGDDTFAEMIAKHVYYLAAAAGKLPQWAHSADPKWYMHAMTYFGYLGARDAVTGVQIANILFGPEGPSYYLLGMPVQFVQAAPSATATSTVFAILAALTRACRVYRHTRAVEFKMTDQLRWLEAETSFGADMPLDMVVFNEAAIIQLKTHS